LNIYKQVVNASFASTTTPSRGFMAAKIARAVGCFPVCGGDADDVTVSESGETGEAGESGAPAVTGEEEAGEEKGSKSMLCRFADTVALNIC
jgi:hypothetical protein